jgi:2-oxoisovalerate dehydrogenase E1 component
VCFLEPIALYHERDLHEEGDGVWLTDYPPPSESPADVLLPGDLGVYGGKNKDLCIVSYANGLRLSLRVAKKLEKERGLKARVIDLRWLAPLPLEALAPHAEACGKLLVVDECRATGAGIADAVSAYFAERDSKVKLRSVRAVDTYVPLGPSTACVLVGEAEIEAALKELAP